MCRGLSVATGRGNATLCPPRTWTQQLQFQTAQRHRASDCGLSGATKYHDKVEKEQEETDSEDPRLAKMRTEAVLLLSKAAVSPRKLAQLAHLADATEARTLVRQLNQTYENLRRAIRIEQVAGGYRMFTHPSLSPWLTRLGHLPSPVRISTPMMETLAVVAYHQPVSRANAEAVRGVGCGELLRQLMERDLVRIVGRGEELGRPYLYGTTKRFLQIFGLPNAEALPPIQLEALPDNPMIENQTLEDLSTSTKELVVSTTVASVLTETDLQTSETNLLPGTDVVDPTVAKNQSSSHPVSEIEDEENEFYDDSDEDDEEDDWGDEGDDWDEEDPDDQLDDDDELDDSDESDQEKIDSDDDDEIDDEDEIDGSWEEVDDEEADEEWDSDDEENDDDEGDSWVDDSDDEDEDDDWD